MTAAPVSIPKTRGARVHDSSLGEGSAANSQRASIALGRLSRLPRG